MHSTVLNQQQDFVSYHLETSLIKSIMSQVNSKSVFHRHALFTIFVQVKCS